MWQQRLDEVVYGGTGFNEQHDSTRAFQKGTEFFDGMSPDDGFSCCQFTHLGVIEPLASFSMKWSTLETVRLNAATVNPYNQTMLGVYDITMICDVEDKLLC